MAIKSDLKRKYVQDLLLESGVPIEQAEIVADVMVTADVYGVDSHGVAILDAHLKKIKCNDYNLEPCFKKLRETPSFAVIDGDNSLGFVSAKYCMDYAVKKAKEVGIFQVFSRNNNTFGPAFYYSLKAAEKGLIGIIMCNSPAQMAPSGGKDKMLGTNPFSVVIPVPDSNPIIVDMATSVVAKSKFKQFKERGELLPDGWALDINGYPTNDPDEGIRGLIQPMAGYKGYALSMVIDILSGVLSGAAYLNSVGRFYSNNSVGMNVGFCCIAIEPQIVLGEEYQMVINDYVSRIRNSSTIEGDRISLPGDRKHKAKEKNELE